MPPSAAEHLAWVRRSDEPSERLAAWTLVMSRKAISPIFRGMKFPTPPLDSTAIEPLANLAKAEPILK